MLWAYDRLAEYLPKELRSNEGLSEAEVKLYGRLVETITEQVQHHFERSHTGSAHLPLEYFSDYSMTDLQVYSETLCELGILEPFKGMCIYVFCIPPKLAYSHAVAQLPRGPSLYKLLVSHLYHTSGSTNFLSARGESFSIHPTFDPLSQALVEAGFAERRGREYQWTEKIAPAMIACREWDA